MPEQTDHNNDARSEIAWLGRCQEAIVQAKPLSRCSCNDFGHLQRLCSSREPTNMRARLGAVLHIELRAEIKRLHHSIHRAVL